MQLSQDEVFANSEGDRWFQRNREALESFDPEADLPLRAMALYGLHPRKVLEVGASNGVRLAEIARKYRARTVAVEPSLNALEDGKRRFPSVDFICGQSHKIPLDGGFDLVVVNFVLHWVDRSRLLGSIAEIDRVLVDGGFLIIGDFHPSNFLRAPYHHLPVDEVYTYKQNYAGLFLASGIYRAVSLFTADHGSKALDASAGENERTGIWLLQKSLNGHYVKTTAPAK